VNHHFTYTNELIHESSPYLRQHAHNPVNWKAWSDTSWDMAVEQNKLVIVSIGYSTCHWCHVMEKVCFEDEGSAELMNKSFISIKVDREARPDVDQIYMDACQLMTGKGGWPLNVICLPDKRPIYAGTYFPKEHWDDLINQLSELWVNNKEKVFEFADRIVAGMKQLNLQEFRSSTAFNRQKLESITENLSASFDYENGGLKRNQKFLLPGILEYLLDDYLCNGNSKSLDFVNFTLLKMANGGIHDHLRGGFYRYATDVHWFAPHFEKMLYDNAQMLGLYSRAFAITKAPLYKEVAIGILEFIKSELKCPEGGYYAAIDADSEGEEGRFYVFNDDELKSCLSADEIEFAQIVYNVSTSGNWENGFNILHKIYSPAELVAKLNLTSIEFYDRLLKVNSSLKQLQDQRIRPALDDKIICSWNGLLLKSLSQAARFLDNKACAKQAQELGTWLIKSMVSTNGLNRIYSTHHNAAFSEDYACLIEGLIHLYELDGNNKWIESASQLADTLMVEFYNPEKQWFAFTPVNNSPLIIYKYDISDDVIPSSNSILAIQLQKLAILVDRNDFSSIAKEMIKPLRTEIIEKPEWYCNWARVAQVEAIGLVQVAATGHEGSNAIKSFDNIMPSWVVQAFETQNPTAFISHKMTGNSAIYICLNQTCFEPVSEVYQAVEIFEDILRY
jgi:uncharacterized protein